MLLNEMKPGLAYNVVEKGDSPATKTFVTSVEIDGAEFEGSGASKKLSKTACARAALSKIFGINFTPGGGGTTLPSGAAEGSGDGKEDGLVPGRLQEMFILLRREATHLLDHYSAHLRERACIN